jgi:hypothetical protein
MAPERSIRSVNGRLVCARQHFLGWVSALSDGYQP